jgi:cobalt/nickel transport system ATP-binding protein
MAEPLYSLTKVSYSYPGHIEAFSNISLSITKGDRIAIIGANGTGKSTLLSMLDALIFPVKGTIAAFGKNITARQMNEAAFQREFRSRVGFVFQNPDIQLFCPTVKDDILFGPLQMGMDHHKIESGFDVIVKRLRIEHLLERSPHQLSIGEKKKAAIAGILIMEPEVLLLDEPTAGLDPQTTRDIIAIIYDAHKAGKTVVIATHDLHIVEEIADIVHVFGTNKSIIRSGTPDEILNDHNFMQQNNLIHVHVHRHFHSSHLHEHGQSETHEN